VVSVDGECVESKAGDLVRETLAGNTCVRGVVFAVCLCEGWQSVRLCDGKVGGGVGERPRRRPCSACPCAPEFQNLQTMFVNLRADPFFTRPYSLWGSNPRPMAHKTIALTTELRELLNCWVCTISQVAMMLHSVKLMRPSCPMRMRRLQPWSTACVGL
jgi:hypothetical protein